MALSHRGWTNAAAGTLHTGAATVWSVNATASATGTLQIYDNTSAAGTLIFVAELAAGANVNFQAPGGIKVSTGIHVVQSGTAEGAILVS